jgi:dihydrodipicolinate synthase/N-acetylneuraminate lyase
MLNTPFSEDLSLDLLSVERTVDRAVREGVAGCIVPAVAGEVAKLTMREREEYVECVTAAADRRLTIIAGVSANTLAESLELARHALSLGCDGILAQPPANAAKRASTIRGYFRGLAEAGAPLLVVQDLDWQGPGMPISLILELFESIPSFRAIKVETVPAGSKYTALLDATGGELTVSGGWALPQMIEGLDRGVRVFHPTGIYRVFVHILDRYDTGDRVGAKELFDQLLPALTWFSQHIDISIHFLKRYCVRRGDFTSAQARSPILNYDAFHERMGSELIEQLLALDERLEMLDGVTG